MEKQPPPNPTPPWVEWFKQITENLSELARWIAELIRTKNWVSLLLLVDAALLIFLLPDRGVLAGTLQGWLPPTLATHYATGFWLGFAGIFLAAIAIAVATLPRAQPPTPESIRERKAIKGLRAFDFGDADIFARLQRDRFIGNCVESVSRREFRLGILMGESGCGKTSLLRAGAIPSLRGEAERFGVYARLEDRDPVETIRATLAEELELLEPEDAAGKSLRELLDLAAIAAERPILLAIDQFEQFFVHFPRKADREPFVRELADWYGDRESAAAVLVSIRGDFADRLVEFHQALKYTLGPQDVFRLERFEPPEAAAVLQAIAELEGLPCDRGFLRELAELELASREDGLVLPADLQVLAWTVAQAKSPELRAFNRQAFQKLGGLEGLMERFVRRTLEARVTATQKQAALKVLLALTDLERNARAGTLTVAEIGARLQGALKLAEVEEAANWLARGDVRLVTAIEQEPERGYELAHERLIPALRRVAGQELSAADRANQLLDRRTNEWLGNGRSNRYLLNWRELWLISQQKPYLVWGSAQKHKLALLRRSRRRRNFQLAIAGLVAVLASGWQLWRLSPPGQMRAARRDLARASISADDRSLQTATETLAANFLLEDSALLPEQINGDRSKAEALRAIASAYGQLDDAKAAGGVLATATAAAESIDGDGSKADALRAIASAAGQLDDAEAAGAVLATATAAAESIDDYADKAIALRAIASAYGQLDDAEAAGALLATATAAAESIDVDGSKAEALSAIASAYGQLDDAEAARGLLATATAVAESSDNDSDKARALSAIASAYSQLDRQAQARSLLDRAFAVADPINEPWILSSIAIDYARHHDWRRARHALRNCPSNHRVKALATLLAIRHLQLNPDLYFFRSAGKVGEEFRRRI